MSGHFDLILVKGPISREKCLLMWTTFTSTGYSGYGPYSDKENIPNNVFTGTATKGKIPVWILISILCQRRTLPVVEASSRHQVARRIILVLFWPHLPSHPRERIYCFYTSSLQIAVLHCLFVWCQHLLFCASSKIEDESARNELLLLLAVVV